MVKALIILLTLFIFGAIIMIAFIALENQIMRPLTRYRLDTADKDLKIIRRLPWNRQIILKPSEIRNIEIELLMGAPRTATIETNKTICLDWLTREQFKTLTEFAVRNEIDSKTVEIYHGGGQETIYQKK